MVVEKYLYNCRCIIDVEAKKPTTSLKARANRCKNPADYKSVSSRFLRISSYIAGRVKDFRDSLNSTGVNLRC